jgi:hypothetical protein
LELRNRGTDDVLDLRSAVCSILCGGESWWRFGLWIALAIVGSPSARLRYALSCAAMLVASALPVLTACDVYRAPRQLGAYFRPAELSGDTAALTALTSIELLPRWIAALEA